MSEKDDRPTASKTPTHVAYEVRSRQNGKGFWTHIGAAWPHTDGKGFNIQLENVPLDGRVVLRVLSDERTDGI